MGLKDLFRRGDSDAVKDPFGGGDEDFYDDESRLAGKGPKIALIASGALFLVLVGGVAAIFLTGDKTPATTPMVGSLADLQVEDDAAPAAGAPGAAAPAAKGAAQPVVADATAATDRSVSRRPWLEAPPATPAAAPPRLGMTDTTPPKGAVTPATPPAAKTAPAPAAPAPATKIAEAPKPPEAKPADAKAAAKPPETKTAAVMTPPAATAPAMPAGTAMKPVSLPPADTKVGDTKVADTKPEEPTLDLTKDIAGIPPLRASDEVPGAPRLFDLPKGSDGGPTVAGGRPRLVEPPLPPTDKIAVEAPPPRYAALTDVKKDAIAPPAANAAKVAFVVDGLGLSASATDAAINKLPAAVTLAFSPYARDLKKWVEKAKAKGHEVLIEVPMESKQFPAVDPGPLGLLTSVDAKENQERLDTILKASTGAVGVLDDMGSKFRESSEYITPVFAKLKQSNLFYVQGEPGVRVGEASVPTAISDVVIDERPFRAAIDARLDYAERLAKYQGSAVASVSAKPVSFERLVLWLEQAQKKGVTLAPISQVLIKQ